MTYALWIVQALLAALFLFAGGVKLTMPLDEIAAQSGLPGPLILFVSVAELVGAVGLILPGLLRIRPDLTPLAAAGLTIIMAGATISTFATMDAAMALFPLATGLFTLFVAYGRLRRAPHRGSERRAELQIAG